MASEFELIQRYFSRPAPSAVLGVGDDCALVRPRPGMTLAVTTDMLLEGTHFRAGADARRLGHKSLAVDLSGLAAVGGALGATAEARRAPRPTNLNFFFLLFVYLRVQLALRRDGALAGDDIWM